MIGKIYITGLIGNKYNDDGSIAVKGVELQDVVMQVNANKGAERLDIYINSQGGSVRVGKLIADYVSTLPNAYTIADGQCASMGTEIHLARPIAFRKMVAGTDYFVHSPLFQNVSGNADELVEMADSIRETEREMLSMYCKATGIDKNAMLGLMKQETSLNDEQVVSLGFASEIIPKEAFEAVAFLENKKSTNQNIIESMKQEMKSFKEQIKSMFAEAFKTKAVAEGEEAPVAMQVETDKGVLVFESNEPKVGDIAMIEGAIATEGDYTLADGSIYKIDAEGKLSEIVMPTMETPTIESLQAEIEKLKLEKEEIASKIEAEKLKEVEAEITALKSQIGSSFKPVATATTFRKQPVIQEKKSIKELAAERKKQLAEKKQK